MCVVVSSSQLLLHTVQDLFQVCCSTGGGLQSVSCYLGVVTWVGWPPFQVTTSILAYSALQPPMASQRRTTESVCCVIACDAHARPAVPSPLACTQPACCLSVAAFSCPENAAHSAQGSGELSTIHPCMFVVALSLLVKMLVGGVIHVNDEGEPDSSLKGGGEKQ